MIDPSTAAASFATIVGLLSDYASGKSQQSTLEMHDFLEWLQSHGHNEIKELIERNEATTISLKAGFAEGKQQLLERLVKIDEKISALSIGHGPLHDLAISLNPSTTVSGQARDLLIAMELAQVGRALEHSTMDGPGLVFLDGNRSQPFEPSEPRFLRADLDQLTGLQLLSVSLNSAGKRVFQLTRRGAEFARSLIETQ